MAVKEIGTKFTISDNNLKINGSFGTSKVIPRDEITNIQSTGNLALAIWSIITVFMVIRGIRMLLGQKYVVIERKYGKNLELWANGNDVRELKIHI